MMVVNQIVPLLRSPDGRDGMTAEQGRLLVLIRVAPLLVFQRHLVEADRHRGDPQIADGNTELGIGHSGSATATRFSQV